MIFDSIEEFFKFCTWHRPENRSKESPNIIVTTSGVFDLLHADHIKFLKMSKRLGQTLIVLLNSDSSVAGYKSASRPVKDWLTRATILNELASVDYVVKMEDETPMVSIMRLRPNIWTKGNRPKGEIVEAETCFLEHCDVVVLWNSEAASSTDLIAKAAQVYQDEQHKPAPSSGVGQDGKDGL